MSFLKKTEIKPGDIVIIAVLILLSFSVLIPFTENQKAETVIILQDENKAAYPINKNRKVLLDCGGSIQIQNGKVFADNMPCPDKLCEKCGKISSVNESILCLPNNVAVKILSGTDTDLDGISE